MPCRASGRFAGRRTNTATLSPAVCAAVAALALQVRAADKVYVDEVAAFGKIVDIWPDGKMPGDKTDKPEVFDNGQPKGDVNYQHVSHPTLTIRKAPGDGAHPAMLICPGGGYFLLAWRHEGMETRSS